MRYVGKEFYIVGAAKEMSDAQMIERCREDCHDFSNLQPAGEQLSPKILKRWINLRQVNYFQTVNIKRTFLAKV